LKTKDLIKRLEQLESRILELEQENTYLKARLTKFETPKNSRNSSIPPSQDQNRPKRNQSLRTPTGKKPGGQLGRKVNTLKMVENPDKTIELHPDYCSGCGSSLLEVLSKKKQTRQIVDIPPIKAVYTEYQAFSKVCKCGCETSPGFPKGVDSPISYGKNIEGLIGYYYARQYVPFQRMHEMFNDVFDINISEGGIHYLLNRFSDKVTPVYELIKQRVAKSKVIGTDETGVKVNGKRQWYWVWQTDSLTFIAHSENRKQETIKTHFPNGFPDSTLVHDGWKPQINTPAKNHQTCLAHLQRHLIYLNKLYPESKWGSLFLELLYKSLNLYDKQKINNFNIEREQIMKTLDEILNKPPDPKYKELVTFYKRMCREKEQLFTFLFVENVPPDNNASERAIRNVKVKQKISGQFKIKEAAQNFAKIRSVIDTCVKNGMKVLEALRLIADFEFNFSY
jgi:transposase